ncbi:MAG: type IX secretion system protein PorQ [Bacteroidota bacterium]|nr:type IX secretion system protein PorQ [Bacteroidota bacterium]
MSRNLLLCLLIGLFPCLLQAQTGDRVYQFLDLPVSVIAAGNGGNSVSSPVPDLNLTFNNPALLSPETHNQLAVGYLNYISDINAGSVAYSRKINDRSQWMAGIRYVDYGSMPWTSETNELLGETMAQDLAVTGTYSWMLSQYVRAGSNINLIYSVLDEYTSVAVGVDLGLYYCHPNQLFSAGLTVNNLGSQIVSYDGQYESMPWDVRGGVSYKLAHAPFRLNFMLQNLSQKSTSFLAEEETTTNSNNVAGQFFKHALLGVDFLPSDQFQLSLGYNYRRVSELGIAQRTFFGGFSAGMLLRMKKLTAGASYAKYHVGGSSLQMTLALNASMFGL